MNLIKKYWQYILIFFVFGFMSLFFPLTGEDLFWASTNSITSYNSFFEISNGKLLSSLLLLLITRYKMLKILSFGVISTCLFVLIKNIVNRKNDTLIFIGIFIFLLINNAFLSSGFVNSTGFINNTLSTLIILIFMNMFLKDRLYKKDEFILFLLGLLSSLINPIVTMFLLIITFTELFLKRKEKVSFKKSSFLLFGILVGAFIIAMEYNKLEISFLSLSYSKNILHSVIPIIFTSNFLIYLIFIGLLLILSIKVFLRGNIKKKILTVISIFFISFYSFVYILSLNDILNYISFVLFTVSSIYLLLNLNNSIVFKRKIKLYYFYKILYIFIMCFSSEITYANMLFPIIIDILIILELVNYAFPVNFLNKAWLCAALLFLISNTYIYRSLYIKNDEMNIYIKRHLECGLYNFSVPSKYETDYFFHILPEGFDEDLHYINYYKIDIDRSFNVYFAE